MSTKKKAARKRQSAKAVAKPPVKVQAPPDSLSVTSNAGEVVMSYLAAFNPETGAWTMQKWTPGRQEPWTIEPWFCHAIAQTVFGGDGKPIILPAESPEGGSALGRDPGEVQANRARIVSCINACKGMTDPRTEIAALRARVEFLESEMRARDEAAKAAPVNQ